MATMKKIVDHRDAEYRDAWMKTNEVVFSLVRDVAYFIVDAKWAFFSWVMILNKLMRVLSSPENRDHWIDIQGYAQLVLDYLGEDND